MSDLKNKVITVKSITKDETWKKYAIQAEEGGTYTFFEDLKDGGKTKAYENLKELNPVKGSILEITYSEKENPSGKYPYKNIVAIKLPDDVAFGDSQHNTKKSEEQIEDVTPDWDKISWGKCKYGFLIELLKKDWSIEDAEPVAELWADASMRKNN